MQTQEPRAEVPTFADLFKALASAAGVSETTISEAIVGHENGDADVDLVLLVSGIAEADDNFRVPGVAAAIATWTKAA